MSEWDALECLCGLLCAESQYRLSVEETDKYTTKLGTAVTKTNLYALGTNSLLFRVRVREYAPVVALKCFPSEKNSDSADSSSL